MVDSSGEEDEDESILVLEEEKDEDFDMDEDEDLELLENEGKPSKICKCLARGLLNYVMNIQYKYFLVFCYVISSSLIWITIWEK